MSSWYHQPAPSDEDVSESTDVWVRRALDEEDNDDIDKDYAYYRDSSSSEEEEEDEDSAPPMMPKSPRRPKRDATFTAATQNNNAVDVVETLRILNSGDPDADIEMQQVWEEVDDETSDMTTRHSDSMNEDDGSLAARIRQPLVYLKQTVPSPTTDHESKTKKQKKATNNNSVHFSSTKLRLVVVSQEQGAKPRMLSRPMDLLAVETGRASIICKKPGNARSIRLGTIRSRHGAVVKETKQPMLPEASAAAAAMMTTTTPVASEVGLLGGAWRGTLKRILLCTLDQVNRLRLGRILQVNIFFLTAYESYLLSQVIEGLDRGTDMEDVLHRAFQNRNVSRLIVQAMAGSRYDFLYHWPTAVQWNRALDLASQFPIISGITSFPATENFPTTRNHALASIFRVVLGPGNWLTRVLTGGRQGLITDNPNNPAQNLTAESNGFELANRNQYGTHFGRIQTNKFRLAHRLPTDESLVRSFVTVPIPTMTNNGVVHCLRQLSKHWHNMVSNQVWGNFAHQRQEQLAPFETLRVHMPAVLLTLSSLRGRNVWDAQVMGPVMQKLTNLSPETTADKARKLLRKIQRTIVVPVCGGIPSVVEPFQSWLEAIGISLDQIEEEAKKVYEIVSSVELGTRLGHDIMTQVSWKVPSDAVLKRAILQHIQEKGPLHGTISTRLISSALERTTPRDKRTLIELVRNRLGDTTPAKLLLARVKTLLQREIRRDLLDEAIRCLSKGEYVTTLRVDDWYWLESSKHCELYVYCGANSSGRKHQFRHVASGSMKFVTSKSDTDVRVRAYIPVGEAICRAQKALLTIELDHGKKFTYNAFMEFLPLRTALRRLAVVGQMACEVLDNARLNVLSEIQRLGRENKTTKAEPQNIVVIGGGPGGMMACLHCTENCLASGGVMKLFEARDSFAKGGSTYERAQIVRLDARWIAMMRYHLGTGFEDVFIPASGETDAQLGNALPAQGFVEITIKDLENILHVEVTRLWSKSLISVFTDSRSQFDPATNSLTKLGENLKVGDVVLRKLDCEGRPVADDRPWKVVELVYTKLLGVDDLRVGADYGVYDRTEEAVFPFKLVEVDLDTKKYHFQSPFAGVEDLRVSVHDLPSVYPAGTGMKAHADVHKVVVESLEQNSRNGCSRVELLMDGIKKQKFTLDVGNTHVVEAIGKPHDTQVHLGVATSEPHGVCCLEGLKVSLGMHNFGEKRWGSGILDDIRSLNDRNTRIIGDFTKMVRTALIVKLMHQIVTTDLDWALHFNKLVADSAFPELNSLDPVVPKISSACEWLADHATKFRRPTLQTRFFEVGDNFYLGMEFPREYNQWKRNLAEQLVVALKMKKRFNNHESKRDQLKQALLHSIDRLWYFACLETIRTGDVYNPGARRRVPRLFLINSSIPTNLGSLPVGESFRLIDSPQEKYEILATRPFATIVRNVEGYVLRMNNSSLVTREGNLTRCPDGNQESKVALSSFPVSHFVNHRTMRVSDKDKGYVFTFIGDEQASPHFMRYSGLTGACINAMSFNNFIQKAIEGVPFVERFGEYSKETNWSNGEVVQRGTGGNYGEDGFLRPGFSYHDCMDYLYSKIIEYRESNQDLDQILSRDWKVKIASSLVPRGMELNPDFTTALQLRWQDAVFYKFLREVQNDDRLRGTKLEDELHIRKGAMGPEKVCSAGYWDEFLQGLRVDSAAKEILGKQHVVIASRLNRICRQIIDFAAEARLFNERVSSELVNQPKPVDSIVDDFAIEAQGFANSLTMAAAFSASILALRLIDGQAADLFTPFLGVLNIIIAFTTMTNVARYKIRNEEARIVFKDEKFLSIKMAVFAMMDKESQISVPTHLNPLLFSMEKKARRFQRDAIYYDYGEAQDFNEEFKALKKDFHNIAKLESFQKFLARRLIADAYHINSYVQESLVDVYRTVDEVLCLLRQRCGDGRACSEALDLFYRLIEFENRLEYSMQRGPVRWGFVKIRKFVHWDIVVVIRYFYSLIWFCPSRGCRLAPIEIETASLLQQLRLVAMARAAPRLRRELFDFETLQLATRESDISSLIYAASFLTLSASIVFTIARVFMIQTLIDWAFLTLAISSLGAILAMFHLNRKFFILLRLWIVLRKKDREVAEQHRSDLRLVRGVTFTQVLLTLLRFCSASAAAIALMLAVATSTSGDKLSIPQDLPFWIAMGAMVTSIVSTVFFFVVEFGVRYKLSTELGPFVCRIFKNEIKEIHNTFAVAPTNSVDTEQVHETEAWEYTARDFLHKYRFDTVFLADRFGQILQFIQSTEMKNMST